MNGFDDSDIKIADAGAKVSDTHKADDIDAMAFLEETKRQHFNGNTAKAKQLGRDIVSAFSYKSAPEELYAVVKNYVDEPTDKIMFQVKILSVFSAEYCLEHFLPSQHLSAVAADEMYDVMRETDPEFFDALARSSAFSFYYLCTGENGVDPDAVAAQFASLCGAKNDKKLTSLGRYLFDLNVCVFGRAVNGFVFA